jgi:hypothetical protein
VRPGRGPFQVGIQARQPGDAPHLLRTVYTDRRGFFRFTAAARPERRWRAYCVLPSGRLLRGPFVRAYRFG